MISEKAVKIHVEFNSFLYRIEVDETSLREFAAKLQGHVMAESIESGMQNDDIQAWMLFVIFR